MQEYKVTFHTHDAVFWKMYTALCLPTKRFLFVGQVVVVVVFPWFYRIYGSFWILVFFLLVPNGETRKNRSCIVFFLASMWSIFPGPYIRIPDPSVPLCSLLIFVRNGQTRDIVAVCPWGSGPRGFFPLALVIHCFY